MKSAPALARHTTDGFTNTYDYTRYGFGSFLKWVFRLAPSDTPPFPASSVEPYVPPVVKPDRKKIREPDLSAIQLTWIGHSTFLIQAGGLNILTDPIFGTHASPFSRIGPKRRAPLPCALEELPEIDAVVISHDHYDHLDKWTIDRLGNAPRYFVPPGLGRWFREAGIAGVSELDWWNSSAFGHLRIRAVPSQHYSGRSPFKCNGTLWCGWVIESAQGKIYFAGDCGYSPHFKEIAARAGSPLKLALLPIGAYNPRALMRPVHLNPSEAVQAFIDLGAEQAVAMHWGTFKLTTEPLGEPPAFLRIILKERNIDNKNFAVLKFGETATY